MSKLTPEQRKARLTTGAKWGIGLTGAIIIAPVIFLAIKGIVGLAIASVLGLAIVHGAPVLGMKFANWKLKAIKAEAAKNPVETMQSVLVEKDRAVSAFALKVEDFATEVRGFRGKLEVFRKQFPADAPKFDRTLADMQTLLDLRRQRLREARAELSQFALEINKAEAIWKMSLAASSVQRAAGMTEDNIMQRIKTETAVDAVESSLNRALSQLETALLEESPALAYSQPGEVIDVQVSQTKERIAL